jgi:steroid 5-alpha reductase family enzyme
VTAGRVTGGLLTSTASGRANAAFDAAAFVGALPWVVAGLAVVLAVTFAVALRLDRHSVIDSAWGVAFTVIAVVSFAASSGSGDDARRVLVTALTVVWGLRLAIFIAWRQRGEGEDPRYAALLSRAPGNPQAYALRMVYLLQGVIVLFVSLPVQVTQYSSERLGVLAYTGVAVWAVGLAFEAVGDAQKARFKADPANRGVVLDRGLWRYTRHPNYFGDACVWWGLFLVAADAWPGALTVFSPLLMTFILVRGTGKKLSETRMRERPGFTAYVERTSGFVPLPPRQRSER